MKPTLLVVALLALASLVVTTQAQSGPPVIEPPPIPPVVTAPSVCGLLLINSSCGNHTDCKGCSTDESCFWCAASSTCNSPEPLAPLGNCSTGWCNGDSCNCDDCTKSIYPCSRSIFGMILLMLMYGVIIAFGAKTISDGSELLLELFPKASTVIGALLLPVLGAVPDAAIVIASGALGTRDEAQSQVAVGVGALAGSTIMLLTVPWAVSMFVAKCDLGPDGKAIDERSTHTCSLTKQGVSVDKDTPWNARIMLITAVSYFLVQGVAFKFINQPPDSDLTLDEEYQAEKWWVLSGFIVCSIGFIAYSIYQILVPKLADKRKARSEIIRQERVMTLRAHYYIERLGWHQKGGGFGTMASAPRPATPTPEGHGSTASARALRYGRLWRQKAAARKKAREEEEAAAVAAIQSIKRRRPEKRPLLVQEDDSVPSSTKVDLEALGSESKEPEGGEPQESFGKTLAKSIIFMILGVGLVTFFSDPLVDTMADFAGPDGVNINPFYVSFILTPFCSNASEVISSLIFAAKKRKQNSSMTYSQLYGAACMNATLVLGVFFALIFFRQLAWSFTAETLAILLVTLIVGLIGSFQRTIKVWWAFVVISLYPLSLVFVYLLENFAKWT